VTIDVRRTEAAAQSDEVMLIHPGSDAALALAMMQVIIGEGLYDADFVAADTLGFEALSRHVRRFNPEWAAAKTGIAANRIVALAHAYATIEPATMVLGGSSLHKGANAWHAARAVSCLPAYRSYGVPAAGGASWCHRAWRRVRNDRGSRQASAGKYVPNQMSGSPRFDGREVARSAALGTNMLSSFPDSDRIPSAWTGSTSSFATAVYERDDAPLCRCRAARHRVARRHRLQGDKHSHLSDGPDPNPGRRLMVRMFEGLADRLGVSGFTMDLAGRLLNAILDQRPDGRRCAAHERRQMA
jgi:hypothetical protein